jgi:hypothetical protein
MVSRAQLWLIFVDDKFHGNARHTETSDGQPCDSLEVSRTRGLETHARSPQVEQSHFASHAGPGALNVRLIP